MLKLNLIVQNFPKKHKYTNGSKLIDLTLDAYDCVKTAASISQKRKEELDLLLSVMNKIQGLLRIGYDLHFISDDDYIELANIVESIEKQQYAWYKSLTNKEKIYNQHPESVDNTERDLI